MPTPSGQPSPSGFTFFAIHRVSDIAVERASDALDRALMNQIGFPEGLEIREMENDLNAMAGKVRLLAINFTLSKLVAILPVLVMDGANLYEKLKPRFQGPVERKQFVTQVIKYVYKKANPDLPYLVEPFETMVEDMILNSVPDLLDNLEAKLNELISKLTVFFK
jgi:hypothetical protein